MNKIQLVNVKSIQLTKKFKKKKNYLSNQNGFNLNWMLSSSKFCKQPISLSLIINYISLSILLSLSKSILNLFKQQEIQTITGLPWMTFLNSKELQLERMKLIKSQKLIDEPIHPKIANYKIDFTYVQYLFNKYYNSKNIDYKQPYQLLNLLVKKKLYRINNRICMSITSLEDVPQLQLINTNLIQPILNYDQFNSTFEKRMNKLMNRNSQIQQSIRQYNYLYYNQRTSIPNCKTSDDLPTLQRQKLNPNCESDILILPDHRTQRTNYRFAKLIERQENKNVKPINIKDQMELVLMQKIKRHHTSSERDDTKQISRSQLLRSVKSEHLLIEQEIFFKKFLQPIKEQKFKIKQNK
ncbi:unnamed protein product [Paramecium primaurelia]|uniref:Uncharacterized protein n=1 Tax=Paramecium primaurelia TaxID=5886 RepID=A0A8S1JW56_PARPR|nr:unnamed protein product [Paramecium primaurelia]